MKFFKADCGKKARVMVPVSEQRFSRSAILLLSLFIELILMPKPPVNLDAMELDLRSSNLPSILRCLSSFIIVAHSHIAVATDAVRQTPGLAGPRLRCA